MTGVQTCALPISVVLLTSIGEGTKVFIIDQFTQFGANMMVVSPGKSETLGIPGLLGGTTRPLTIQDSVAIGRLPEIEFAAPLAFGNARVEAGQQIGRASCRERV